MMDIVEDIVSTSRMMVNRLMDNVKHYYTNTFADNIVYVKRYGKRFEKLRSSRNLSTFVDEDLYLLKQYLHGKTCSLERIAKDVLKETKRILPKGCPMRMRFQRTKVLTIFQGETSFPDMYSRIYLYQVVLTGMAS